MNNNEKSTPFGKDAENSTAQVSPTNKAAEADHVNADEAAANREEQAQPIEIGGPQGPEPTRYGDCERKGRCVDF